MSSRKPKVVWNFFKEGIGIPVGIFLAFIPFNIVIYLGSGMLLPFIITMGMLLIFGIIAFFDSINDANKQIKRENAEILAAIKGESH